MKEQWEMPSQSDTDKIQNIPLRRRFLSMPTLLSFAIAVSVVIFFATRFDLDWNTTWVNLKDTNPLPLIAGIICYYISFLIRGLRWKILSQNTVPTGNKEFELPTIWESSQFILIGWFVNSVMWLRLGDAYRAYLFSRRSSGNFSWSLGIVLAERIIDIACIVVIMAICIVILTATHTSYFFDIFLYGSLAIGLGAILFLVVMKLYGKKIAHLLPLKMESIYNNFHDGTLGSLRQLPTVIFLGLLAWLMEISRLYFILAALNIDAPMFLIPIVALAHSLLSIVPTPGGVGVVEPGMIALLLISLKAPDAISIALLDRCITFFSVIATGGSLFLIRRLKAFD